MIRKKPGFWSIGIRFQSQEDKAMKTLDFTDGKGVKWTLEFPEKWTEDYAQAEIDSYLDASQWDIEDHGYKLRKAEE